MTPCVVQNIAFVTSTPTKALGKQAGSSLVVLAEVGTTDSTLADESFSIYICGMVCFPVRIYFLALWYPTHYVCERERTNLRASRVAHICRESVENPSKIR